MSWHFRKKIDKNELIKLVSSIFGYKNLTESTSNYIEDAINVSKEKFKDRLSILDGNIIYIHEKIEK